jgi:CTP synthase (UTP-ammonia lyase)
VNRSRLRRHHHRVAIKMLEMIARGGTVFRNVPVNKRVIEVSVTLPNAKTGGSWFMAVQFTPESLRGEPGQ